MKTLLTGMLMLTSTLASDPQNITYSYDSAGNRIKREIIIETVNNPRAKKASVEQYSDIISDKEIKIYPNPTYGILKVEIIGFEENDVCEMHIFDLGGQKIHSIQSVSSLTEVDLSSKTNGIYLLHISLNGEKTSWKIIKQ